MLAWNPVTGAGNQVEIVAGFIAKNLLQRGLLWRVERDVCDTEGPRLPACVYHNHIFTAVQIAQVPKNGRIAPWTVEMPINNRAANLTRSRASFIPANMFPLVLFRGCEVPVGADINKFNRSSHANRGNDEACWFRHLVRCRRISGNR